MTLMEAIVIRIKQLLKQRNWSQYRLEQNSGVSHNTMTTLFQCRNKSCNIATVVLIIRAFGMTVAQFFDDPIFESEDLEVE